MEHLCSTPETKFTLVRVAAKSPLPDISQIHESPQSFDLEVKSRGASFVSTPISIRHGRARDNQRAPPADGGADRPLSTTPEPLEDPTPPPTIDDERNDGDEQARFSPASTAVIVNPFESYLLDRLHTHTCSPSIFAKVVSPGEETYTNGRFWSIDHIALINPVDIDISSFQQSASMKTDYETESRIQATVDQYFAESVIAPSPWCESSTVPRRVALLSSSLPTSPSSGIDTQHGRECDAATQTEVTFPPDFDTAFLLSLLGEMYLYKKDSDESPTASRNISATSLRRKLFESCCAKKRIQTSNKGSPLMNYCDTNEKHTRKKTYFDCEDFND